METRQICSNNHSTSDVSLEEQFEGEEMRLRAGL
jgi:hypothetical protein